MQKVRLDLERKYQTYGVRTYGTVQNFGKSMREYPISPKRVKKNTGKKLFPQKNVLVRQQN